ncbi:MAG: VWA domain-containing protein [Bdellovibrionales bacterium]|nr:VWA domain-containing protein [Bdellovibrionales bacterium]
MTELTTRSVGTAKAGEAGTVLILLALVLAAVIALIALGIDLSIVRAQRAKHERTAEQAALAALETYMEVLAEAGDEEDALTRALARAEDLAELNLETHFTSNLRVDKDAEVADLDLLDGINGAVIPGRWFHKESDDSPCRHSSTGAYIPCFRPLADPREHANAMRVILNPAGSTALRVLFSGLLPKAHSPYVVSAIATLVPRRAVFLLDLSRSIIRDSHPQDVSEYAFFLERQTRACGAADWWDALHPDEQPIFDALPESRALSPGAGSHFKSDYTCQEILGTNEYYAVDTVVPPEPLNGILDGVRTALLEFEARSVNADRVGIMGFDDEILPMRRVGLTAASASNPSFQNFLNVVDPTLGAPQRVLNYLFPRFYGSREITYQGSDGRMVTEPSPAMSDISMALSAAREMLKQDDEFYNADNFVVLFSDGLANCPLRNPPGEWPCDSTEPYLTQAIDDLDEVAAHYKSDGIALHVFLIGAGVGPHTLLRKMGVDGGCMTDDEARTSPGGALSFVDPTGGSFGNSVWYYPNRLYHSVAVTGGLWSPQVDCCRVDGECTRVVSRLQTACRNASGEHGSVVVGSGDITSFADGSGRLICDAQGRTKAEQVQDSIREIMSQNPFILVNNELAPQ